MPTPVGPAPRDPNDPDLWDEWYEGDSDGHRISRHGFPWPVRVVALLILIGILILIVLAR